MELKIPVKGKDKTKAILTLLNPFLGNMTDREISMVSSMIDKDITSLNKNNRADLRDSLNMDKYTFNNYVQNLKKKGILIQSTTDVHLNPQLKVYTADSSYTVSFVE